MLTNIIAFVIVLGVLIFIHELGHFLVARFFGVGVEKFSLGFGPRIFGKKVGLTDYRISAIPLGGYVKMVGEEPDAEIDPNDIPFSFTHKHVFKRMAIVAAGPLFNIFLAVFIYFIFYMALGNVLIQPVVGDVPENKPAFIAGIQKDDRILSINGMDVDIWEDVSKAIESGNGLPITVDVERNGEIFSFDMTPERSPSKNEFGEDIEKYLIGIAPAGDYITTPIGIFESFTESLRETYFISGMILKLVVKMVKGSISAKELGGPIMIAQMAGSQARAGVSNLIAFIALISINLAILNFLPIPVLDGGHLLFYCIEVVMRKPVSIKMREMAQQAGMFILLMLMIFVFYNDIMRYVFK